MSIYLSILISVITAVIGGQIYGNSILSSVLITIGIYFLMIALLSGLIIVLSHIFCDRKYFRIIDSRIYDIIEISEDSVQTSSLDIIPRKRISEIFYSDCLKEPLLTVKRYNVGGWRRKWLVPCYDDHVECILILPKKTED